MRAADGARIFGVPVRSELHQEHDGPEAGDAAELLQVPDSARAGDGKSAFDDPYAEAGEATAEVFGFGTGAEAAGSARRWRSAVGARSSHAGSSVCQRYSCQ